MNKRVLIVSEVYGDTRRYRALHLYEQLRLAGAQVAFCHLYDARLLQAAREAWDLVVFHRVANGGYVRKLYHRITRSSHPIICCDYDDLIFDQSAFGFIDSPDFADPIRARLYQLNMRNWRSLLELSEAVTTSTDFLADTVRGLGKPAWVHRNAFSLEMYQLAQDALVASKKCSTKEVVIGYGSGTNTHNRDFALIRPVLQRIMAKYPFVKLHLVGPIDPGDGWGSLLERIYRTPLVPWRQLPAILEGFDINLAPLRVDNPFSQSKSEIKFVEAGMVAVPTVASPTDAFCHAIRNAENGFLAGSEAEWESALVQLVEDRALRKEIGERARAVVLEQYHPAARVAQLRQVLDEMFMQTRGTPFGDGEGPSSQEVRQNVQQAIAEKCWIPQEYEKNTQSFLRGIYSIRQDGALMTLMKVWVYFRRMVAPIFPFPQR